MNITTMSSSVIKTCMFTKNFFFYSSTVLRHFRKIQLQLRETLPMVGEKIGRRSKSRIRCNASSITARSENGQRLANSNRKRFARSSRDRPARRRRRFVSSSQKHTPANTFIHTKYKLKIHFHRNLKMTGEREKET